MYAGCFRHHFIKTQSANKKSSYLISRLICISCFTVRQGKFTALQIITDRTDNGLFVMARHVHIVNDRPCKCGLCRCNITIGRFSSTRVCLLLKMLSERLQFWFLEMQRRLPCPFMATKECHQRLAEFNIQKRI